MLQFNLRGPSTVQQLLNTATARPIPVGAHGDADCDETDHGFIQLLGRYRKSGGLARANEVFIAFGCCNDLGAATLASWVARRSVLSFHWSGELWLPYFQFEREWMTIKPALQSVLAALNPVYTPWQLGNWWARPNRWLGGESPADAICTDAQGVLRAACAERLELSGAHSLKPGP